MQYLVVLITSTSCYLAEHQSGKLVVPTVFLQDQYMIFKRALHSNCLYLLLRRDFCFSLLAGALTHCCQVIEIGTRGTRHRHNCTHGRKKSECSNSPLYCDKHKHSSVISLGWVLVLKAAISIHSSATAASLIHILSATPG